MTDNLKRILYLEDDDSISEITKMAFDDFSDFDVLHCRTGKLAIEAFPEFKPDMLLFDVMLPDLDGPGTLRASRDLPDGADVPVVFMTAKAQNHEQQTYFDLGAIGIIVKPFDAFSLSDQVLKVWNERHNAERIVATSPHIAA